MYNVFILLISKALPILRFIIDFVIVSPVDVLCMNNMWVKCVCVYFLFSLSQTIFSFRRTQNILPIQEPLSWLLNSSDSSWYSLPCLGQNSRAPLGEGCQQCQVLSLVFFPFQAQGKMAALMWGEGGM